MQETTSGKFQARVNYKPPDQKQGHLRGIGTFDTAEEAGQAVADAEAKRVEVYINEDEYITLSESESGGSTSDASVTATSRQEHIDDATRLLPMLIRRKLGHAVAVGMDLDGLAQL